MDAKTSSNRLLNYMRKITYLIINVKSELVTYLSNVAMEDGVDFPPLIASSVFDL